MHKVSMYVTKRKRELGKVRVEGRTPFLPGIPQFQNMMFMLPSAFVAGLAKKPCIAKNMVGVRKRGEEANGGQKRRMKEFETLQYI